MMGAAAASRPPRLADTPTPPQPIAGRDRGHTWAALLHHAGALVAEHGGEAARPFALHDVVVAVADAGGAQPHAHLPLTDLHEAELLELQRLSAAVPHRRGDGRQP